MTARVDSAGASGVAYTAVDDRCLRMTVFPAGVADPFTRLNGRYLSDSAKDGKPDCVVPEESEDDVRTVGQFGITTTRNPLSVIIRDSTGRSIQTLTFDAENGDVTFAVGKKPIYGLGQGFATPMDRRGAVYDMACHGQEPASVFEFATISAIPYIISLEGWGIFFHEPVKGTIDLSGEVGRFSAHPPRYRDIFIMTYDRPEQAAGLYYKLTGYAPMPPRYAFGYQQSFRELHHDGKSIVMSTAQYIRENRIPCDVLIYLGRYVRAGWNTPTHGGMFEFNSKTFPDAPAMIQELHDMNFKVVFHITETPSGLHGQIDDAGVNPLEYDHVRNYWHRHVQFNGHARNDGWWPDDGDELDLAACTARHKMYFDGTQQLTPGRRGFYMLRNAYCGDVQYGGIIWSGDVLSKWETLKNHVFVGLNVSMSLSPYWGSDIGGFHVTEEYSGELYLRWFEYSVFCPMFRSHGRHSFLHTPWGWRAESLADIPDEWARGIGNNMSDAVLPDHRVESICREYIELRYRLIPYIYTLARIAYDTGVPLMRPMWFGFPDDEVASVCESQYLFGSSLLVNPVTKKGATKWETYLPKGRWYDFFTNEVLDGACRVTRTVSLRDIPVYVPAGTILPLGEISQFLPDSPLDAPGEGVQINVYEGADGEFTLYEDDGITTGYQAGTATTYTHFRWNDSSETLTVSGTSTQVPGKSREFRILQVGANKVETVRCVYESR